MRKRPWASTVGLSSRSPPFRVRPLADRAEELHVGPRLPVLVDDPADDGAPGLELHGQVSRLVAFQDERAGQLAAPVEEVEPVRARG